MSDNPVLTKSQEDGKMNAALDICKILMAVLVVGIHTRPFGFNDALQGVYFFATRLCVPFFFTASAYFFYLKQHSLLKYIKRIGILYLVWFLLFLPINFHSLMSMSFPELFVKIFLFGPGQGMWYLTASIWGMIILEFLLKIFKPKTAFVISCLLFVFGCWSITWANSDYFISLLGFKFPNPLGHYNATYRALAFMAMGMLLAKGKNNGKGFCPKFLALGFAASFFLMYAEYAFDVSFLKSHDTHMNLFHLPAMFFFFSFWNNIEIPLSKDKSVLFRKISILLYLSHRMFRKILIPYFDNFMLFATTLIISLAFCYAVVKLSERKTFNWLKWLY